MKLVYTDNAAILVQSICNNALAGIPVDFIEVTSEEYYELKSRDTDFPAVLMLKNYKVVIKV